MANELNILYKDKTWLIYIVGGLIAASLMVSLYVYFGKKHHDTLCLAGVIVNGLSAALLIT